MNHLEQLVFEYYDWKGYIIRANTRVGKRALGGWEMELDICAYDPSEGELLHIEPSTSSKTWKELIPSYEKKFEAGRKYIILELFPWLDASLPIHQVAILPGHPKGRDSIAGGELVSIDEFVAIVREEVKKIGIASRGAIPEKYPLLRTIQYLYCGYNSVK